MMQEDLLAKRFSRITAIICYTGITLSFFRYVYNIFFSPDAFLTIPQDDFYFYFITAKHIVHLGRSTFDGITLTNGYHPLWMTILLAPVALSFSNDRIFFFLLALLCSASAIISYRLITGLFRRVFSESWIIYPAVIISSLGCTWTIFGAMESAVAIPCYVFFVSYFIRPGSIFESGKQSFLFGLFASVLILSRLDSVLFVLLFVLYHTFGSKKKISEQWKVLPSVIMGAVPVLLYGIINLQLFDTIVPVSSTAKLMKKTLSINPIVFGALMQSRDGNLSVIFFPLAFLTLIFFKKYFASWQIALISIILIFPLLYFLLFSIFSDWSIFIWYTYMIPVANGMAILALLSCLYKKTRMRFQTGFAYGMLAIVTIGIGLPFIRRTAETTVFFNPHPSSIYAHAKIIKTFTDSHPGFYAMGDRSGLTSYVTGKPILQVEGLAADKTLIRHISNEDRLDSVLKEYHVDYLIVSSYETLRMPNGCYKVEEPMGTQAGPHSKKMQGQFCSDPVFYYKSEGNEEYRVPIYTYIFKID